MSSVHDPARPDHGQPEQPKHPHIYGEPVSVTLRELSSLVLRDREDGQWWLDYESQAAVDVVQCGNLTIFAQGEAQATLRKWAAADDLLEACDDAMNELDRLLDVTSEADRPHIEGRIDQLKAAIRKATGGGK